MSARSELTLEEALADPIVQAVMAADRVDRKELEDMLARIARTLAARSPRQRSPVQTAIAGRKIPGLGDDLDCDVPPRPFACRRDGKSAGQAHDREKLTGVSDKIMRKNKGIRSSIDSE